MKYPIFFLAFLFFLTMNAQEVLSSIDFDPERNDSEAITVIDNEDLVNLFITNTKEIKRLKFKKDYQLMYESTYEAPRSRFSELSGYAVQNDGTVDFYYSNSNNNKFCLASLKENSNEAEIHEFDFKLKDETYLQGISHQKKFYILTIDDKSVLKLYEFDGIAFKTHDILMGKLKFDNAVDGSRQYPRDVLTSSSGFSRRSSNVDLVDASSPNSIETVSKLNKVYTLGNSLILTVDYGDDQTYAVEINLVDMTSNVKTFNQPTENFERFAVKSNSYLYDGKLFQCTVSRDRLVTLISDYESQDVLKRIDIERDDEISIANSAIIQEGGAYDNYRELEKTSQLLRKMTSATPGISVYELNGKYEITLGGSQEIATGGAPVMMPGFGGIIGGAVGGLVAVSISPTFSAYNSYTRTKSTYFISVFDKGLNHLDGEVDQNVFDRISDFTEDKKPSIETVFRKNGSFIYGYFDKKEKKYDLVKFED